jgi:hypothetical protein
VEQLAAGIIIGLLVSVIAKPLTAPLQKWLTKSSPWATKQRASAIRRELERVEEYTQDRRSLWLYSLQILVLLVLASGGMVLILVMSLTLNSLVLSLIGSFVSLLTLALVCAFTIDHIRLLAKIRNFTEYKVKMEARLRELDEAQAETLMLEAPKEVVIEADNQKESREGVKTWWRRWWQRITAQQSPENRDRI